MTVKDEENEEDLDPYADVDVDETEPVSASELRDVVVVR